VSACLLGSSSRLRASVSRFAALRSWSRLSIACSASYMSLGLPQTSAPSSEYDRNGRNTSSGADQFVVACGRLWRTGRLHQKLRAIQAGVFRPVAVTRSTPAWPSAVNSTPIRESTVVCRFAGCASRPASPESGPTDCSLKSNTGHEVQRTWL
jgi:hypothetical protein